MVSVSDPTSGTSSPTCNILSTLPRTPFFTKTSQLAPSRKRNHHFRVTCQAKDGEQNASRRNVMIGLGGLYGGATLANDPFSLAEPIAPPVVSKCSPVNYPCSDKQTNCCPPLPQNIVDFKFPPPPTKMRVRPAAHLVDQAYIKKFEKAIELMKALPDSDPRNFRQQANVHCAYCDGAYDQVGFPKLDLQVHSCWLFFPFHRLYLYFFERICGKLLNDPTFAMPFWNWDAQGGMTLPAIYADSTTSPLYDKLRDDTHQPPTVIDLDFNGTDRNIPDNQLRSQNIKLMYRQMVSSARTSEQFFGCPYRAGDQCWFFVLKPIKSKD